MFTRSHLQSPSVNNHRTRGNVTITLLDCFDESYVLDAGIPKGEGACHANRPGSNNEDSCA